MLALCLILYAEPGNLFQYVDVQLRKRIGGNVSFIAKKEDGAGIGPHFHGKPCCLTHSPSTGAKAKLDLRKLRLRTLDDTGCDDGLVKRIVLP